MKCRVCESNRSICKYSQVAGYNIDRDFEIRQCKECGICFSYPFLNGKEIKDYYDQQSIAFNGAGDDDLIRSYIKDRQSYWKKLGYDQRIKEIRHYLPNAKSILDIGCGAGIMLDCAKNNGFKTRGIELSSWGYQTAKKELDLRVYNRPIKDISPNTIKNIDVITMYDVIEHSDDPIRDLKIIKRFLNKDGIIIINVPNIDSYAARMTSKNWNKLIPPNHTFHFNRKTLHSVLKRSGYSPIRTYTNHGTSEELMYETSLAFWWHIGKIIPAFQKAYSEREIKLKEKKGGAKYFIKSTQIIAPKLAFMGSALKPLLSAFGAGEGLRVIAKVNKS